MGFFHFFTETFSVHLYNIYDEQEFNTNRNENNLKCGYIHT